MKVKRKIIEIDEELCDGCGQCIPSCSEGALQIIDGKARLVSESYCDGLGACLGECPQGALRVVEREAEEFDEEAVEEYLEKSGTDDMEIPMGVCPSAAVKIFGDQPTSCETANIPRAQEAAESRLGHWPVQINLVPVVAPFLKNASILILADCTAVAYANLHQDFLDGRAVMMGCPKFDDVEGYLAKLTEIFKTANAKQVTVLHMEVPCCSALPMIVRKAIKESGKIVPYEEIMIGTDGKILSRS